MNLELVQSDDVSLLELAEGEVTLGGGVDDQLLIEGLAPALLTLEVSAGQITVTAREAITIAHVLFPPRVARLLLPGESLGLTREVMLRVPRQAGAPDRESDTAQVLLALLRQVDASVPSRAASLTILTGLEMGRRFPLAETETEIGRGRQAHVRIRDRAVSRRHAQVRRTGDHYRVENLGSPNGLFLNGERLQQPRPLREGDLLELGHSVLRFEGPANSAEGSAAPPLVTEENDLTLDSPSPHGWGAGGMVRTLLRARSLDWALIVCGASLVVAVCLVGWGLA